MSWPVPTRRAVLVGALAAVVLAVRPEQGTTGGAGVAVDNRLWAANGVLLALFVADFLMAPRPASFAIGRHHPAAIVHGAGGTISWTARRDHGRATRIWIADHLAPSLHAEHRRVEVRVPARGEGSAQVDLRPHRRGRFVLPEVVVRTRGPLGLVHRQQTRPLATELRVFPRFRSAKEAELTLRRARLSEVGLRSARGRGGGTDFDSLREWSPDDEFRRIDWAATARAARPIVRTYRSEQNQSVLCVLDSGRIMAGTVDDAPRLEHGMDAAMLLAEVATGLGDRMGLLAFDGTVHTVLEASARRSQRAAVTEATFDLHPALIESDYQAMVTHIVARYRRRHLLVLVTELDVEVIESFLLPALPRLTRTHLVVVASIRDPQVERWAVGADVDPDATGEEHAFLRASAANHLGERRWLAQRLKGVGVLVVDETPDRFARSLSRLYLEAKAIGRL